MHGCFIYESICISWTTEKAFILDITLPFNIVLRTNTLLVFFSFTFHALPIAPLPRGIINSKLEVFTLNSLLISLSSFFSLVTLSVIFSHLLYSSKIFLPCLLTDSSELKLEGIFDIVWLVWFTKVASLIYASKNSFK